MHIKVRVCQFIDKVAEKVNPHRKKEYFVFGRRTSGYFDIRTLDGERVNKGSINYKKLKLLEIAKGFLTERKVVA
jgi:N6-L-threonylcarbamoyladenine synthase